MLARAWGWIAPCGMPRHRTTIPFNTLVLFVASQVQQSYATTTQLDSMASFIRSEEKIAESPIPHSYGQTKQARPPAQPHHARDDFIAKMRAKIKADIKAVAQKQKTAEAHGDHPFQRMAEGEGAKAEKQAKQYVTGQIVKGKEIRNQIAKQKSADDNAAASVSTKPATDDGTADDSVPHPHALGHSHPRAAQQALRAKRPQTSSRARHYHSEQVQVAAAQHGRLPNGSKAADDTFASIPHYGRDLESLLSVYFDQLADKVLLHAVRIYVYELPEMFNTDWIAKTRSSDADSVLLELKLHTVMKQQNALRVSDADNANLFFVPAYPVAYCTARTHQRCKAPKRPRLHHPAAAASDDCSGCASGAQLIERAANWVDENFDYWKRHNGGDHIFMAFYKTGPCMTDSSNANHLPHKVKDAIFLSPFGLSSDATASSSPFAVLQPCYTRSTIIVPPYVPSLTSALSLKQHRPPPKRDLLAMFRGAVHKHERASRLRKRLIKAHLSARDVVISSHPVGSRRYIGELHRSKFCLCLPSDTMWSLTFYEALVAGCVPVLFDDNQVLPFSNKIQYSSFVVSLPSADIQDSIEMLRHITDDKYNEMVKELHRARPLLMYQQLAFKTLLYEVFSKACSLQISNSTKCHMSINDQFELLGINR